MFEGIGDWSNEMAKDMMPLEQEMEAFGEKMPEAKYDKEACKENIQKDWEGQPFSYEDFIYRKNQQFYYSRKNTFHWINY